MSRSRHLDDIINLQRSVANMQVVFADIENYSKRSTQNQVKVVHAFSECLKGALEDVSREYVSYAQANDANFATDIVRLPTGDGAALVFTFDGLHDMHLSFACRLITHVQRNNDQSPCDKFKERGWCTNLP